MGTDHAILSTPKLLIIDELGYLPMPAEDAATLFQVISRRYGKGSIILTTNLGVTSWGEIFADHTIAAAMLDRLLHKSVVFTITGDSYRLRSYQAQARNTDRKETNQPKITDPRVGNFDDRLWGTSMIVITGIGRSHQRWYVSFVYVPALTAVSLQVGNEREPHKPEAVPHRTPVSADPRQEPGAFTFAASLNQSGSSR